MEDFQLDAKIDVSGSHSLYGDLPDYVTLVNDDNAKEYVSKEAIRSCIGGVMDRLKVNYDDGRHYLTVGMTLHMLDKLSAILCRDDDGGSYGNCD